MRIIANFSLTKIHSRYFNLSIFVIYSTRRKTFNCHIRMSCFIIFFMTERNFFISERNNLSPKRQISILKLLFCQKWSWFKIYVVLFHIHLPQAANNYHAAQTGRYIDSQGRLAEKPWASDSQVDSSINATLRNVRLTARYFSIPQPQIAWTLHSLWRIDRSFHCNRMKIPAGRLQQRNVMRARGACPGMLLGISPAHTRVHSAFAFLLGSASRDTTRGRCNRSPLSIMRRPSLSLRAGRRHRTAFTNDGIISVVRIERWIFLSYTSEEIIFVVIIESHGSRLVYCSN